jgi:hypothetical protein
MMGGCIKNLIFMLLFNIVLSYEFSTFSEMTFPLGMNSDGTIIVGTNLYNEAVIWSSSDGVTIVGDGEFWSISEDGKIAGSLINDLGKEEAVIWENGNVTYLGNLPGGNSCDAFYSSGLGMSSDGTTVVGMGWMNCGVEAFAWNSLDGIIGLGQLNGNNTKAQAVNGNGSMIGGWAENNSGTRQSCFHFHLRPVLWYYFHLIDQAQLYHPKNSKQMLPLHNSSIPFQQQSFHQKTCQAHYYKMHHMNFHLANFQDT